MMMMMDEVQFGFYDLEGRCLGPLSEILAFTHHLLYYIEKIMLFDTG